MADLPLELVSEIIGAALEFSSTSKPETSTKPPWNHISALSLSCKVYRNLALQKWFSYFYTKDYKDLDEFLQQIPQARKRWVRQIHCVQSYPGLEACLSHPCWNLEGYDQVKVLRLDWTSYHWIPHEGNSHEKSSYSPVVNCPPSLETFDYRGLCWPYPNAFLFIAQSLPSIKRLILHQKKIWCGLCFTVCEVELREPLPESLLYKGGLGLPMHYAKALRTLPALEHIQINTVAFPTGHVYLSNSLNENMWVGECASCMRLLYPDPEFVNSYVSRKKEGVYRMAGCDDLIWPQPPSLKTVQWTFRKAADEEVDQLHAAEGESEIADEFEGSDSEEYINYIYSLDDDY